MLSFQQLHFFKPFKYLKFLKPKHFSIPFSTASTNPQINETINPNDWQEIYDSHTGLISYYNPITKENRFDLSQKFKKGTLWKRFAAAMIDLLISQGLGFVCGSIVYLELNDTSLGQVTSILFGGALFMGRDAFIEAGTRSIGKKLMKLEIVMKNGKMPRRFISAVKNFYYMWLIFPALQLSPAVPIMAILCVPDLIIPIFNKKGKRMSDLLFGSTVIDELPNRKERVEKQKQSLTEIRQREEIDSASPMMEEMKANIQYHKRLEEQKNIYVYSDQSLIEKILYPVPHKAKTEFEEFIQKGRSQFT